MAEQSEPTSSGLTSSVSSAGEDATESSCTEGPSEEVTFRLKAIWIYVGSVAWQLISKAPEAT